MIFYQNWKGCLPESHKYELNKGFFRENTSPSSNLFRVNEVNDNKKWRPNCYLYPCVYSLLPGAMTKIFFVYDFYIILWSKNSVFVCLFFVVKNYVKKNPLYNLYLATYLYPMKWIFFKILHPPSSPILSTYTYTIIPIYKYVMDFFPYLKKK